jgi:leader peptidase (prepilin peptidase)/N-methyltransferase
VVVGWVGVLLAMAAGASCGWGTVGVAGAIARPRYAIGAAGHDPEDHALAPLRTASTRSLRWGSAVVGALAFAALAASGAPGEVVAVLCATTAALGVACLIDLQYLRLPDLLTYGTAAGSFVALAGVSLRLDTTDALRGAVLGGLGFAGFLFAVAEGFRLARGRAGMGLGDVKLALSLGATAGWVGYDRVLGVLGSMQAVVSVLVAGNLLGVVGGLLLTRRRPQQAFPFGPFLLLGWLGVVSFVA